MEITPWHRLAHLYLDDRLEMKDIVVMMTINAGVGLVDGGIESSFNLMDTHECRDAMVLAIVEHSPTGNLMTYGQFSEYLKCHGQTAAGAIHRLEFRGVLLCDNHGWIGNTYTIVPDVRQSIIIPPWLVQFACALVDLASHPNTDFRLAFNEQVAGVKEIFQGVPKRQHWSFLKVKP